MNITLNGKPYECPNSVTTLSELLENLELNAAQVVVEHNGEPVERDKLGSAVLAVSDSVEIIHFVGGG